MLISHQEVQVAALTRRGPTLAEQVGRVNLDKTAVLFATEPLSADTEIIGHPQLKLWVSSTAADQDFFFYLESVNPSGKAELIGDGAIRASNRAVCKPPDETFGAPWHASTRSRCRQTGPISSRSS